MVNKEYLERGLLKLEILGRGYAWLDTGTFESLQDATNFINVIESRQNTQIACLEEIALRNKWIDKEKLIKWCEPFSKSNYGKYIIDLANRTE